MLSAKHAGSDFLTPLHGRLQLQSSVRCSKHAIASCWLLDDHSLQGNVAKCRLWPMLEKLDAGDPFPLLQKACDHVLVLFALGDQVTCGLHQLLEVHTAVRRIHTVHGSRALSQLCAEFLQGLHLLVDVLADLGVHLRGQTEQNTGDIEAFLVQLVELRLVLLKQQDVLVEGTLHVHLNAGSGTTAEGIHQRAQFTIHGSRLTVPSRVGGRVSLCALLLHLVEVAMQEFVLVRLLLPGVLEPFLGLSQEVLQGVGCHLL